MSYTEEIEDYLKVLARDRLEELEAIEKSIEKLPPREKVVIVARHVQGMQFKDILKKFPASERNMYNIYKDGLKHLDMTALDNLYLERFGTVTPF